MYISSIQCQRVLVGTMYCIKLEPSALLRIVNTVRVVLSNENLGSCVLKDIALTQRYQRLTTSFSIIHDSVNLIFMKQGFIGRGFTAQARGQLLPPFLPPHGAQISESPTMYDTLDQALSHP